MSYSINATNANSDIDIEKLNGTDQFASFNGWDDKEIPESIPVQEESNDIPDYKEDIIEKDDYTLTHNVNIHPTLISVKNTYLLIDAVFRSNYVEIVSPPPQVSFS